MDEIIDKFGIKKICMSIAITIFLTIASGLVGWTWSQVRDLPQNYIPRAELKSSLEKISLDLRLAVSDSREETRIEVQKLREDIKAVNDRLDSVIKLLIQNNMSNRSNYNE